MCLSPGNVFRLKCVSRLRRLWCCEGLARRALPWIPRGRRHSGRCTSEGFFWLATGRRRTDTWAKRWSLAHPVGEHTHTEKPQGSDLVCLLPVMSLLACFSDLQTLSQLRQLNLVLFQNNYAPSSVVSFLNVCKKNWISKLFRTSTFIFIKLWGQKCLHVVICLPI